MGYYLDFWKHKKGVYEKDISEELSQEDLLEEIEDIPLKSIIQDLQEEFADWEIHQEENKIGIFTLDKHGYKKGFEIFIKPKFIRFAYYQITKELDSIVKIMRQYDYYLYDFKLSAKTNRIVKYLENALGIVLYRYNVRTSGSNCYWENDAEDNQREDTGNIEWLRIKNTTITDINIFLPLSESLEGLDFSNCVIENITGITNFPYLQKLMLHLVEIKNTDIPLKPNHTNFSIQECHIQNHWEIEVFDLRQLSSIALYFKELYFYKCPAEHWEALKYFTQVEKVHFTWVEQVLDLAELLPIASQIQELAIYAPARNFEVKNLEYLKEFTQLQKLDLDLIEDAYNLKSFQVLLPLATHLKKLEIVQDNIKDIELIQEFQALEELTLRSEPTKSILQAVTSLSNLKKLYVSYLENIQELDLSRLVDLEVLDLYGDKIDVIKGFEHLQNLKKLSLDLSFDNLEDLKYLPNIEDIRFQDAIDINKVPAMPSLKILQFEALEGTEIKGLEQFPNVVKLKIDTAWQAKSIDFGKLPKLKVLVLSTDYIPNLEALVNLEVLDLSLSRISEVKGLNILKNLKRLDLSENEIKNIEDLEGLDNLETLELSHNEVSDISVLEKLPKLKEVNLGANKINKEEAEEKLKHIEKLVFFGLPVKISGVWRYY